MQCCKADASDLFDMSYPYAQTESSCLLPNFWVVCTCAHRKIQKITAVGVLDCGILIHRRQIIEYDLQNIFVIMSRKGGHADLCVERTVAYLLRCPRSTVPEVMCASKSTLAESNDATKQMAVRRV